MESYALPEKSEITTKASALEAMDKLYAAIEERTADCIRLHAFLCKAYSQLEFLPIPPDAENLMAELKEVCGDMINTPGTAARLYHEAHVKRHEAEGKAKASHVNMLIHRDAGALLHLLVERAIKQGHHFGDRVVTGDLTHHDIAQEAVKQHERLFRQHHQSNLVEANPPKVVVESEEE